MSCSENGSSRFARTGAFRAQSSVRPSSFLRRWIMEPNEIGAFDDDEIMGEIRQYRRELAERFNHDVKKIIEHVHQEFEKWKRSQATAVPKQPVVEGHDQSPSTAS